MMMAAKTGVGVWVVVLMVAFAAGAQDVSPALGAYREELAAFRKEFGGERALPRVDFFLFGMGPRVKLIYRGGVLREAVGGKVVREWKVEKEEIVPPAYRVELVTEGGKRVSVVEDEAGVWIEEEGKRQLVEGTKGVVKLPTFEGYRWPGVMRVLHQELLVNVIEGKPVPNFFVYDKPWYRDGAMMGICFKATGNLDVIREWVLGLEEVFDRNNNGEMEADNPGQALYLISLVSDRNHPLVPKVMRAARRFEVDGPEGKYIKGRSDFAEHPAYQTKWMKSGLRALGMQDPYVIPRVQDSYSALFWMDYRETYVKGGDSDDRGNYPYLGWACDHFHGVKKSPISDRDYPLTWEQRASQAKYEGIRPVSAAYAEQKLAAPHTWHAAEIFLYLLEEKAVEKE